MKIELKMGEIARKTKYCVIECLNERQVAENYLAKIKT